MSVDVGVDVKRECGRGRGRERGRELRSTCDVSREKNRPTHQFWRRLCEVLDETCRESISLDVSVLT